MKDIGADDGGSCTNPGATKFLVRTYFDKPCQLVRKAVKAVDLYLQIQRAATHQNTTRTATLPSTAR